MTERNIVKIAVKEDGDYIKDWDETQDFKTKAGQIFHINLDGWPEDGDIALVGSAVGLYFIRYKENDDSNRVLGPVVEITIGELSHDFEFSPELASAIYQIINSKRRRDIFDIEGLSALQNAFKFMRAYIEHLFRYIEYHFGNEYAELKELGYAIEWVGLTGVDSTDLPIFVDTKQKVILLNEDVSDNEEQRQAIKELVDELRGKALVG